jgi:DSBA-like thioredoxin domain
LGDQLRFVFRHFARPEHAHALHAAEAAEAASAQGHFWEMHDQLFEHQGALTDSDLVQYAADLGLDLVRFRHNLTSHVYVDRVQRDIQSGAHCDVHGISTFFINGVKHEGPDTFDDLMSAMRQQLRTLPTAWTWWTRPRKGRSSQRSPGLDRRASRLNSERALAQPSERRTQALPRDHLRLRECQTRRLEPRRDPRTEQVDCPHERGMRQRGEIHLKSES